MMENQSLFCSIQDDCDTSPVVPDKVRDSVSVAALVLAAGSSRRMGSSNKLLSDIAGTPMIRHIVNRVNAARVTETTVVTGYESGQVGRCLDGCPVNLIYNPDYDQGLSASLKCGLSALQHCDGVLVLLGDMPHVSKEVIDRLVKRFCVDSSRPIVTPVFQGQRGNPVILPRRFYSEIQRLSGDYGARKLIEKYHFEVCEVNLDDPGVLIDIDTPDDLDGLAFL